MKILIFALVGVILGVGVGGGLGGIKAKNAILEVRADSLEQALADSALAASHVEPDEHGQPIEEDPEDPVDPEPETPPADSVEHAVAPPEDDGHQEQPAPATEPVETQEEATGTEGVVRLAKIFMAMKPRDAAEVLTYLNDKEVEAILFRIREKNAAEILGNFPPDRAAVLSRSVLSKSGGVQ